MTKKSWENKPVTGTRSLFVSVIATLSAFGVSFFLKKQGAMLKVYLYHFF